MYISIIMTYYDNFLNELLYFVLIKAYITRRLSWYHDLL